MKSAPDRQVREDGKDKNSVVSFTLTDEPQHIDLVASNSKEEVRRDTSACALGAERRLQLLRPANQITPECRDGSKTASDSKFEQKAWHC